MQLCVSPIKPTPWSYTHMQTALVLSKALIHARNSSSSKTNALGSEYMLLGSIAFIEAA